MSELLEQKIILKMKNIHLAPTNKPSRLHEFGDIWFNHKESNECFRNYNIYITSDKEIKEGDWFINSHGQISKCVRALEEWLKLHKSNIKKIILTTDQDLIADGIQAIDDEFLEWFVNNSSCECIEVIDFRDGFYINNETISFPFYKIIIPKEDFKNIHVHTGYDEDGNSLNYQGNILPLKEEPKQETIEDASEVYATNKSSSSVFKESHKKDFIAGAKWQQEQDKYSEEDNKIFENINLQTLEDFVLDSDEHNNLKSEDGTYESFHKQSELLLAGAKIGAMWHQVQDGNKYNEEDMIEYSKYCHFYEDSNKFRYSDFLLPKQWFEQFKK